MRQNGVLTNRKPKVISIWMASRILKHPALIFLVKYLWIWLGHDIPVKYLCFEAINGICNKFCIKNVLFCFFHVTEIPKVSNATVFFLISMVKFWNKCGTTGTIKMQIAYVRCHPMWCFVIIISFRLIHYKCILKQITCFYECILSTKRVHFILELCRTDGA